MYYPHTTITDTDNDTIRDGWQIRESEETEAPRLADRESDADSVAFALLPALDLATG